jgi:DNA-binding response OmpR family regulator
MAIVSGRPVRILLAEDDPAARDALQRMLEKHGFGVGVANDGLEAIEMARIYYPDIALIAISLPSLDGYEVARRIRASLTGQRPILMVAMLGDSRDYRRALESGFVQDLLKPIDPRLLFKMLDRLVP